MKRNISVTVVCLLLFILVFSDKVQAQRLFVLVAADTADNNISETELDYYEPFPSDHLIKINRLPIRTANDFHHAMRSLESNSGDIQFVVVDNRSGRQIHYKTRMNPRTDRDFGIKPWFWKDSLVVIHEVRPGSPAARAKAVRIVDDTYPRKSAWGSAEAWSKSTTPCTATRAEPTQTHGRRQGRRSYGPGP